MSRPTKKARCLRGALAVYEPSINDGRIIHLIQKWLKAGVLEDGALTVSATGTGQGSVISPLLANVYLHYVFDLWAERWRHREAKGRVIIVRYADDLIVGFEHESDARRFWDAMRYRLEKFSLSLHPEKTRLIQFGRFAADRRARRGLGKPETFNFLGFTFICSTSRNCSFLIKRKTRRDRLRAKLCFFPRVGRARGAVGTSGCSGRVSNGADELDTPRFWRRGQRYAVADLLQAQTTEKLWIPVKISPCVAKMIEMRP
jgi:hypothetical protein